MLGGLITGETDEVAENVEKVKAELERKPKSRIEGSPPEKPSAPPSSPPDKRPVTSEDLHANRNLGNAEPAPDRRLVEARDLHANRNLGNAEPVPDRRLVELRDLHANRNLGNAEAVETVKPEPTPPGKRIVNPSDLHANRNLGSEPETGAIGGIGVAMMAITLATAAVEIHSDLERGNRVEAAAKIATTALSLKASTPWGAALAIAWGALDQSKDPEIRGEGEAAGGFVRNLTVAPDSFGARVLGGLAATAVTTNLSVAASVMDIAKSGFKTSPVGMVIDYFW